MGKVVQISRTVEAVRRADFAAGARHDHDEAERLRCQRPFVVAFALTRGSAVECWPIGR
jgi:hypothetical protein